MTKQERSERERALCLTLAGRGLGPQQRPYEETLSAFKVLERAFFGPK